MSVHPCSRRSAPSRCPCGAFPRPPTRGLPDASTTRSWGSRQSLAVIEVAVLRPDVPLRWLSLAGFLVWLPTLLVRRTRPMLTVTVFGAVILALLVVSRVTDGAPPGDLNTAVVALLIPYSLARWARGEDAVMGLLLFPRDRGSRWSRRTCLRADRIGGTAVVVAAVALGATVRARSMLHTRPAGRRTRGERERLARELHDTVAHHVSAMAIRAQAGLAIAGVAARRPPSRRSRVIEAEASRALAEMRAMVRRPAPRRDEADRRPAAASPTSRGWRAERTRSGRRGRAGPATSTACRPSVGGRDLPHRPGVGHQRPAPRPRRHPDRGAGRRGRGRRVRLRVSDDGDGSTAGTRRRIRPGRHDASGPRLLGGTSRPGPAPPRLDGHRRAAPGGRPMTSARARRRRPGDRPHRAAR